MNKLTKLFIAVLVTLILLCIILIGFSSCGNMSIGLGNFEYNKIHIDTYDYSGCIGIKKWYDNERGIEVKSEDYDGLFFSEGTYILVEDKCPICGE